MTNSHFLSGNGSILNPFSKLVIPGLIFAMFAIAAQPVIAGGGFCAIAYSKSTDRWGESHGYDTRRGAERRALSECGAPDAFIAGWGHNCYVALATGGGGAWGFGWAYSKSEAQHNALGYCLAPDRRIRAVAFSFE
jgi:hypothetical protein